MNLITKKHPKHRNEYPRSQEMVTTGWGVLALGNWGLRRGGPVAADLTVCESYYALSVFCLFYFISFISFLFSGDQTHVSAHSPLGATPAHCLHLKRYRTYAHVTPLHFQVSHEHVTGPGRASVRTGSRSASWGTGRRLILDLES